MEELFKMLGRKAGQTFKKSRWVYNSIFGDEADALKSEYQFGIQMAEDIQSICKLKQSPLVDRIEEHLLGWINDKHRFHCCVIHSAEVNAFALPGGFIFLTDSILDFCDNDENELAFIVAHEIAHVVKGHAFNRMLAEYSFGTIGRFMRVGGLLQKTIRQVTTKYLSTHHSRDNEFEADNYAIRLIGVSQYKTQGAFDLFKRLKKIEDADFKMPEYFSSHPRYDLRMEKLGNLRLKIED